QFARPAHSNFVASFPFSLREKVPGAADEGPARRKIPQVMNPHAAARHPLPRGEGMTKPHFGDRKSHAARASLPTSTMLLFERQRHLVTQIHRQRLFRWHALARHEQWCSQARDI